MPKTTDEILDGLYEKRDRRVLRLDKLIGRRKTTDFLEEFETAGVFSVFSKITKKLVSDYLKSVSVIPVESFLSEIENFIKEEFEYIKDPIWSR